MNMCWFQELKELDVMMEAEMLFRRKKKKKNNDGRARRWHQHKAENSSAPTFQKERKDPEESSPTGESAEETLHITMNKGDGVVIIFLNDQVIKSDGNVLIKKEEQASAAEE